MMPGAKLKPAFYRVQTKFMVGLVVVEFSMLNLMVE